MGSSAVQSSSFSLSVLPKAASKNLNSKQKLLRCGVLNFYQDLLSSSILDLRKVNHQHTVAKMRRRVRPAEGPSQRHDPAKLSKTAFGAMVGNNSSPVGPSFLFTPDAEFGVGQSDLDLVRTHTRQLNSDRNSCSRFAEVYWRCPRTGDEWALCFSRFL